MEFQPVYDEQVASEPRTIREMVALPVSVDVDKVTAKIEADCASFIENQWKFSGIIIE